MDTNVNSEVDMDLLVDDQPNEEKDYLDNVNKEPEKQDPDPDKVVEADLEMDPAAATEAFIRKNFGLSVEDLEEEADDMEESGEEIIENAETVTEDEDSLLGIEPVAPAAEETTVVVTPPAGGDTTVVEGDVSANVAATETPAEELDLEPKTPADVASLENLRAIYSREDEDVTEGDDGLDGDVSLNVTTPNNDVDITLDDKAVTIEPTDASTSDDGATNEPPASPTEDTGSSDDVEKPETEDDEKEGESTDTDSSAESWWMI